MATSAARRAGLLKCLASWNTGQASLGGPRVSRLSGLYRSGYDGPIVIEHEDRQFEGSVDAIKCGFSLARDVLRPLIV